MIITFAVLVVTALYITFLVCDGIQFGVEILWQILLVSFVCSLSELFFGMPEGKEYSKRQWIVRWVLCYIYVNVVVLGCGFYFGWYLPDSMPMVVGMLLCIAAVYSFVYGVIYFMDVKTAEQMNQKLQERKRASDEE
ncbi:MAG: DUF3021 family protein [Lachnospiraceae bacterium]|nr:DUF3021 family protein [Lachnospiraceae bacterium]